MLSQFWVDEGAPDAVRAIQIEGWLDVLQDLGEDEVRQAWANYQRTGPRTARGLLCRPDPGALRDMAMRARDYAARSRRVLAPVKRDPPMFRSEDEKARADEILARAGFTPRRMEVLAKAPLARTVAEAEASAEAPPRPHWTETATPAQLAQLEAARAANPHVAAARAHQARVVQRAEPEPGG